MSNPIVWFVVAVVVMVRASAAMVPDVLRVEYRVNPEGIDTPAPRFSWVCKSTDDKARNERQTAYQILVAEKVRQVDHAEGTLWDSGKVMSSDENQIVYHGTPLPSFEKCFWTVRVWDQDDKPSEYSADATFSTGMMSPADWTAQWVTGPAGESSAEPYLPALMFRKEFTAKARVRRAVVYATAAGVYELSINGKRVGDEYFAPGWTDYAKRLYYRAYDVTGLIKDGGPNAIGAIVGDGWYGLHHDGRGRLGLLAQLRIEYGDGSVDTVNTDPSWKVTEDGPVRMSDMYNGETYDARREMPGWNLPGLDDKSWSPTGGAIDRPIYRFKDETDKVRRLVAHDELSTDVTNAILGDPYRNRVKTLRLDYEIDGRRETHEYAEKQHVKITGKT